MVTRIYRFPGGLFTNVLLQSITNQNCTDRRLKIGNDKCNNFCTTLSKGKLGYSEVVGTNKITSLYP